MGKGLANALLIASKEAFRGASPVQKLTTPGMLLYLLNNNKPDVISMGKDDGTGYLRDVKIRYRTRGVPGKSTTTDDCSVQVRPAYKEFVVPATSFRALGLTFEDDQIAKFEKDALSLVNTGNPMTSLMKDIYEAIIEQANGLIADINMDLLAVQATNFGLNRVVASNAAQSVNFGIDGTKNDLNSGMTKVMSDAMLNEIKIANACIVGSGLVNNYYLQQAAKGVDGAGLNTSQLALPKFYFDPYAITGWGQNEFGLFEKDAVQFVNVCRFRGAKAGDKGVSQFFTLRLPIEDSLGIGMLTGFEFDVQVTYRDCPDTLSVGGTDIALGRGYNIILSSSYQAVNIPSDSYDATDVLSGVNGTFRYKAENL